MTSVKIPRWGQCGIFSIRPWWALPGWALFLCLTLHGQTMPRLILHAPTAAPLTAPSRPTLDLTVLAQGVAHQQGESPRQADLHVAVVGFTGEYVLHDIVVDMVLSLGQQDAGAVKQNVVGKGRSAWLHATCVLGK